MDKTNINITQQSTQSDDLIIKDLEGTVCSPDFSNGCMDVETGDDEL